MKTDFLSAEERARRLCPPAGKLRLAIDSDAKNEVDDQFALAYMNHREDEYGGTLENRLRCAREIVEGVKAACGADFVVSMRLALKTYLKGYNHPSLHGEDEVGRTLEEGVEICRRLEAYGYDCLSVDFGQYDSFYYAAPPCYMEKGRILDLAEQAKAAVSIPILCGGGMNAPALAAQAVAAGKIDAIVLGVAGMEAARTAASRGHTVTLCEGSGQLGGSLLPAGAHDFKEVLNELNLWYQRQLDKLGVTIQLNTRITAQDILAVGAEPVIPPVPGIDGNHVLDCVTALTGASVSGKNLVVIGGGLVGCETALGYAQEGREVTIVEALPNILSAGVPVPESNQQMLEDLLEEAKVHIRTGSRLVQVNEDSVVIATAQGEEMLPTDGVILAAGFRPRPSLASALTGSGIEVYQVGDGSKVGSVMTAVATAYTVARAL